MQDFHYNRARALLANAEEIVSADTVQAAVRNVAEVLNQRFDNDDTGEFPLVLGVMGGAVVAGWRSKGAVDGASNGAVTVWPSARACSCGSVGLRSE